MLTAEPKAYGSSFYSATRVDSPPRGRLTVELDVDVCVIGAGLAGLTAAREVARRGWSVVVLEAQSVAWNASGRSAGVVRPGFAIGADALATRVGVSNAKALWALSEAGVEYVRETAQDSAMEGVGVTEGGWLHVAKTDATTAMDREIELLTGHFGASVEPWPAAWVREVLRSPLYFDALHYPRAFSLHPLNYALGLAASAEAGGARIFEDTPVLEIDPAGVRKRVVTRDSRVRAGHVVLAGNVHLAGLMPELSATLIPVYSGAIITAPLSRDLREAISYAGAVSDNGLADTCYRVVDGERLLWWGGSSIWRGKPEAYADILIRQIRRTYPQLGGAKAEHCWIGVVGETVHGMPQIGEVSPGLWLLSGFGGQGLNTTAIGGKIVARAILDNDHTWQLFSPFALVWAGGRAGLAAQQVHYWTHGVRERIEGMLARRREGRRQRSGDGPVVADLPPRTDKPVELQVGAFAAQQASEVAARETAQQQAAAIGEAVESPPPGEPV
jgi:gamma-glutamylputrescine oxidase